MNEPTVANEFDMLMERIAHDAAQAQREFKVKTIRSVIAVENIVDEWAIFERGTTSYDPPLIKCRFGEGVT